MQNSTRDINLKNYLSLSKNTLFYWQAYFSFFQTKSSFQQGDFIRGGKEVLKFLGGGLYLVR